MSRYTYIIYYINYPVNFGALSAPLFTHIHNKLSLLETVKGGKKHPCTNYELFS